jgi:chemotaxis family two-component system response regulator PixG
LVACIDDSPQVAVEMKRILEPLGYEVLGITEPLQSVSTLLQRKPDLIFLDLVMPNTNGYELCTFLRKTTTFQEIPIVILTGRDGMIDRVRAKMAGSSDFLSKPPDAAKVLQILHKFLQIPKPN